jgi:hypothetical protein
MPEPSVQGRIYSVFWKMIPQCPCTKAGNQFSDNPKCLIGTPDNTLQALSQSKN